MNRAIMILLAAGAAAIATPAMATTVVSAPTAIGCDLGPLSPSADACAGYYDQNVFSNSSTDVAQQQAAIDLLLGPGNYTVDYNALVTAGDVISAGNVAALNALLAGAGGQVILGIHWGNVPDPVGATTYGNVSGFYLWNNAAAGSIHLTSTAGFSDAVLYRATGSVPEPATWAMMLIGFAGIGFSMRGRRRAPLAQLA